MNTVNLKKSTSLRLDAGLYSFIETLAKKENRSINNFIETLLADATHYKEPNDETKKAIEEARAERAHLKRYTDTHELMKDLLAD